MMKVELFADNPVAGRPKLVEFRSERGSLQLHVQRDDGSLWLFAKGPAGGDRGETVLPASMADVVRAWADAGGTETLIGRGYGGKRAALRVDKRGRLMVKKAGLGQRSVLPLPFDEEALAALFDCLREWATNRGFLARYRVEA